MGAIEPDWGALLWFALFWGAACLAFLAVAGMFPLRSRPESARTAGGAFLIGWNALLLLALAIGTLAFGYAKLRWTSLIVAGGLIVLFAPGLFEAWPAAWRDGRTGLVVVLALQVLALGLLFVVFAPDLRDVLS